MTTQVATSTGLSEMVGALSSISDHLLASYAALSQRAEHVEKELVAANQALEERLAELDATRGHLEAILQALPTGVVVRDREGRIVRVNPAAASILGVEAAALIGAPSHPHLVGDAADGSNREIVRPDGRRAVIAARCSQIRSTRSHTLRDESAHRSSDDTEDASERLGSVEILDDRTEVTELAERLHGLDKMAALGSMAGGIAHEIRNPMNAIGGFADLLRREFEPDTRQHRFASHICEAVADADAIITNVLSLANPERLCREPVDPDELVSAAIRSACASLPEGSQRDRWRVTAHVDAVSFRADRIKVRQALRNLVANALEAQPQGGAVEVHLAIESDDVVLRVKDAGPGIPSNLRNRVVEPFFTTRASGTGLGLALVHTIAELHGGRFDVAHEPSSLGGAEMVFRIPFNPVR